MNKHLKRLYLFTMYGFFYLPIIVLIVFSFNDANHSFIWHGFTFNRYRELIQDTNIWIATIHSFSLAITAATIATMFGTIAAVCYYRYRFLGRKFLYNLVLILILTPDLLIGVALLSLFTLLLFHLGFFSLLVSHITFCVPFVIVTILSRLKTFNKSIFEAAKDLGANDFFIFRKILIPLLWPGIFAAWLLSFTLSIDDVIISYFVTGPSFEVLPLRIYSMIRNGVNSEINALCAILFITTMVLVMTSQIILRKKP